MSFRKNVCAASIVALSLVAGGAHAIPFTSTGIWISVDEADGAVSDVDGLLTNRITWGEPFGSVNPGKSAYVFDGREPGDAPIDGDLFELGDFTHENFTIRLPSITGATLDVNLVFDGGVSQTFEYFFEHTETPNNANPCAEGGVSPCPDLVDIPDASSAETVFLEGMEYLLLIEGFSQDDGATITPSFLTLEGQPNTATLYARLELVPPTEMPLPNALALLGIGLLAFGARWNRRRA